jgi:hypothetical protein
MLLVYEALWLKEAITQAGGLPHDHSRGVAVDLFVVAAVAILVNEHCLWRHVANGAGAPRHDVCFASHAHLLMASAAQAEVPDFEDAVAAQQEVCRFQVAVDHLRAAAVEKGDGLRQVNSPSRTLFSSHAGAGARMPPC